MNEALRAELLGMRDEDQAARERLTEGQGSEVRALDERHAARLESILDELGRWPTADVVGNDGSDAAWLILQHAITRPEFVRRCLKLLIPLAAGERVPRRQLAYLLDRVRMFEGRPQVYGTQFVWDDDGQLVPHPIENQDRVDERRASVGLPPLEEHLRRVRESAGPRPPDIAKWRREAEAFARSVGWR